MNTKIKLQILNCNSLTNKLPELKEHISSSSPTILCLSETWLTDRFTPRFLNYCTEWKHRLGQVGGGLGILIHQETLYKPLDLTPFPMGVLEIHGITLYSSSGSTIQIINIYNPLKNVTCAEFHHYCAQLGNTFIIVGDFNAHTSLTDTNDRTSNPTGVALKYLMDDFPICLINPPNFYTYKDRRTFKMSCLKY